MRGECKGKESLANEGTSVKEGWKLVSIGVCVCVTSILAREKYSAN